jgi:flagellum-specific peptidoglycan hydrolase FlgJ
VRNGAYWSDPDFEADLNRYGARIAQQLGPAIGAFARAQARLEVGNGQQFSTPFNFGNIGNTDDDPRGGGGFANPEAAADAWVAFVTNDGGATRYQPFLDAGRAGADVASLARLISQEGYATDPDYATKVAAFAET